MLNRLRTLFFHSQEPEEKSTDAVAIESGESSRGTASQSLVLQARGDALFETGKLDEAIACFREALSIDADDVAANIGLGRVLKEKGMYTDARLHLGRAIALAPDVAESQYLLGSVSHAQNKLDETIQYYQNAIELNPDNALIYRDLGLAYEKIGQFANAKQAIDRGLVVDPGLGELHFFRGNYYLKDDDAANALICFERALSISPDAPAWLLNHGVALQTLGRFEDALHSYEQAIRLQPKNAVAHNNRGSVLITLRRYQEAVDSYDTAIRLNPGYIDALKYRGHALRCIQRSQEALASLAAVLKLDPANAEALHIRALAQHDLNRPNEALRSFLQALRIKPDYAEAHVNEGICRLTMGDFSTGWPKYEWRRKTDLFKNEFPRPEESPLWLGKEPLAGKTLLLRAEQGLGDSIHFCRYVAQAADLGATVLLEVQPPLKSLLAQLKGASRVFARGDIIPAHDYHCQLVSLPFAFKTRLDSIPANIPYLQSDPERIRHWGTKLGAKNKPRVGIAWSGNAANVNDHNRSIPLARFAKIISPGAQFVCLQKDLRPTDQAAMTAIRNDIIFFDETLNDFADTAALIDLMDVVISVDTSVAHLAGALGKPLWLLLPFRSDYRWLLERRDSPWYPTATLFRQSKSGDWDSVLDTVSAALMEAFEGRREYQSNGTEKLLSGSAKT